jgi:hypothetical protein
MRGILTHSPVLDYLDREDVEEKIESLLQKNSEQRQKLKEEFEATVEDDSLSKEEKESMMLKLLTESLTGKETVEMEQRLAALQIRQDYKDFRKNEDLAWKSLLRGNLRGYERAIREAVRSSYMVDQGLEYLDYVPKIHSSFKVTKASIVSKEEQERLKRRPNTITLEGSIDDLF